MKDDKELIEQMIETDPIDFRGAEEYFSKLSQLVRQHDNYYGTQARICRQRDEIRMLHEKIQAIREDERKLCREKLREAVKKVLGGQVLNETAIRLVLRAIDEVME